jgi:DNA-binding helix-hairpin-helix protein with protein kinase domain
MYGQQAVKWYNREQATEEQKTAIRKLARSGPPQGSAGKRFIWPLDLVTLKERNSKQFGYLMPLIDTKRFTGLGEVQARLRLAPSFRSLCEISYQVANSYRALHLNGYCYRDISQGNIMFDPLTGDTLICDNDNVGINRQSTSQVIGTMEYMAPEILRGEATPTTETDQHSLAVLLFQLWFWHHPMHGKIEYQLRSWDLIAKRHVYGETPIFIFDPDNKRNQLPGTPEYVGVQRLWEICPASLKEDFTRAFTVGLRKPGMRVTEGEWERLFLELKDRIVPCRCGADNFWEAGQLILFCWHCNQPVTQPPVLLFSYFGRSHPLLLTPGTKLQQRHINPHVGEAKATTVIGEVAENPQNRQILGIRNLSQKPWKAFLPNGKVMDVPPQKAIRIYPRLKLTIADTSAEVIG